MVLVCLKLLFVGRIVKTSGNTPNTIGQTQLNLLPRAFPLKISRSDEGGGGVRVRVGEPRERVETELTVLLAIFFTCSCFDLKLKFNLIISFLYYYGLAQACVSRNPLNFSGLFFAIF